MTKKLKKPCNIVFNTERIGNLFHKGFIKAVPIIFEGDRDDYFADLLSEGIYFYEKHPNEFFTEKLEKFSFKNSVVNGEATGIRTTIQENYASAIGRDDLVHVDNMSWVWKDSYCRGAGEDLFPGLIEQGRAQGCMKEESGGPAGYVYYKFQVKAKEGKEVDFTTKKYHIKEEWDKITADNNYKSWEYDYTRLEKHKNGHYINKETQAPPTDADKKWYICNYKNATGFNVNAKITEITEAEYNNLPKSAAGLKDGDWWGYRYTKQAGAWKFDGYKSWSAEATLKPGVQYDWYMHAFSSGQKDNKQFKGLDDGVKVILKQNGPDWELAFMGRVEITEVVGNPSAIGGGTEFEDIVEDLPDMLNEQQTAGLESMEQTMQAEAEQQNQFDEELLEELQSQEEKANEKANEKDEELDPEPERTKDKNKDKAKEETKEDEDDVERSGNER